MEKLGSLFFGLGLIHCFGAGFFQKLSRKYKHQARLHQLFHILGEVELVFFIWVLVFFLCEFILHGPAGIISTVTGTSYVEPIFVFAIMALCSSRPILFIAEKAIAVCSRAIHRTTRFPEIFCELFVILFLTPLLGSLITEPAAMTVAALILNRMLKSKDQGLLYMMLAVLFVNVSVGGSLTSFAAPPILMVAKTWNWDTAFIFGHFGWKSTLACFINSILFIFIFRSQLKESFSKLIDILKHQKLPIGIIAVHLISLALLICFSHEQYKIIVSFAAFYLFVVLTQKYQSRLRLKESLLVAIFLSSILILGPFQTWWLQPLLAKMSDTLLFWGATGLTAVTDNAALTYLGSQVSNLSETAKIALVEGALAGGGLTLIANAPNLTGATLLQEKFPNQQISSWHLLKSALLPTLIVCVCYLLF